MYHVASNGLHGSIEEGPRIRAIKDHIGDYVLTRRAINGFCEAQGVKLRKVADAGFRGLEVVVEGVDEDGRTIRTTLNLADVALPFH